MTDPVRPMCIHGKAVYERCLPCEEGLKRGEHGGFVRADQLPSKDVLPFSWTWDDNARTWRISMVEMGDGLLAGYDHLAGYYERRLIEEIQRLRTTLTGISTCSTCEACRGAATRALGDQLPDHCGRCGEPHTGECPYPSQPPGDSHGS